LTSWSWRGGLEKKLSSAKKKDFRQRGDQLTTEKRVIAYVGDRRLGPAGEKLASGLWKKGAAGW